MGKIVRLYSPEFKEEAIRLVHSCDEKYPVAIDSPRPDAESLRSGTSSLQTTKRLDGEEVPWLKGTHSVKTGQTHPAVEAARRRTGGGFPRRISNTPRAAGAHQHKASHRQMQRYRVLQVVASRAEFATMCGADRLIGGGAVGLFLSPRHSVGKEKGRSPEGPRPSVSPVVAFPGDATPGRR